MTGIISFCTPYRFSNICPADATVLPIRWPCTSIEDRKGGWEIDRSDSLLLKEPPLTSSYRLLEHRDTFSFERQCVGSAKGGQRRSLSRRVLPWHHGTSTLLLNLSLLSSLSPLSSLSSVLAARCTHSRGQLQSLASNLLESLVKQTNRFHSRGRATRAPYLLGRHAFSRPFSRFRFMPVHPGFFYSGKFVSSSRTGDDDRVERIAISTRLF